MKTKQTCQRGGGQEKVYFLLPSLQRLCIIVDLYS